jgi:hypothetical protein
MKRVLLVSLGLVLGGVFTGCLPSDNGSPGTGGTYGGSAGTSGGTAGTNGGGTAGTNGGGTAGTNGGGTAGTNGGTAGDQGTAGTTGGTAGTTGGTAGTTGGTAGTTGGTAGTTGGTAGTTGGTAGRAGSGGRAGTTGGTAGTTGGTAGTTGGTAGRGGTTGGTAGTTGGTAGTGAGGTMAAVGAPLDGQMLLGPCIRDTQAAVCATIANGQQCPNTNATDIALRGVLTTDHTITLGGTSGTPYSLTLHVQGEVEAKDYTGGTDQNATLTSPKADGFRTGGTPGTDNNYNVYMIRVTNPGATTHTDYFLNSLVGPGVTNHTTYGIDYTATIMAQGGASLRLVAGDSNCSMIKNCGPTANDGNTCAQMIIQPNIEPTAIADNPTFNFNTAYNGQWIVLTVKNVTSP